jgi:hypothetical protein
MEEKHLGESPAHDIGLEAEISNPALSGFQFLLGTWRTEGTHPRVPGTTFHGRAVFAWGLGGAFLFMHSEVDEPEVPSGVAIFGSDDAAGPWSMIYFDERGISRRYAVTVGNDEITCERDDPAFSQTITFRAAPGGDTLTSGGRMRTNGGPWEEDLTLTYRRDETE